MLTALIIDDEPEANKLLARIVQLRGYQTRSALTGTEGLELAREVPPDVIFLDLMLPDRHGFDVCRDLRRDRATSLVPVVVVTARLADRNRGESYQAGASDFIPKPYTPEQIFQALRDADQWRRDLEARDGSGVLQCDTSQPLAAERELTALRSLLGARTPLQESVLSGIIATIRDLCQAARDWGEQQGVERVARVAYQLDEDRLRLTIRDESAWLASGPPPREDGLGTLDLHRDLFDEIAADPSGRELTLTYRFPNDE